MKSAQVILSRQAISAEEINRLMTIKPQLVFAFGALSFFSESSFLKSLSASLSKVRIIGCSTAGKFLTGESPMTHSFSLPSTSTLLEFKSIQPHTSDLAIP